MTKDAPAFAAMAATLSDGLYHEPGLTKREYAAIHAMQGILANATLFAELVDAAKKQGVEGKCAVAGTARLMADALLAGGEK